VKSLLYIIIVVSLLGVTSVNRVQAAEEPLILGVHPYLAPSELKRRFTPLADYLSTAIGRRVEVRVGRTYAEHVDAIGTGDIDIAYLGPVPYVQLIEKYGKKPLLARQVVNNDPYLRGEIVVRNDSPIHSLEDLKGRCFYFGDPNSTMSSILPRLILENAGVSLDKLSVYRNLEGHSNVALAILAGSCDAGAVKSEVYEEFKTRGLRLLADLPLVTDHVFVASSALPADLVNKIRAEILGLNGSERGKQIMTTLHPRMTALVTAVDADFDSLRSLVSRNK
jgi:phosphonate transport system substrate-binding protein